MDSVVEVILNPLSLALDLHGFCWRSCPLWGEGVFRFALPRYALSFTDSVSSGKDSGKLPRKSIQRYFAMYPRINRQISSITLPSILASFFTRFHWTLFRSMCWTGRQYRESHTDSVVTSHFEIAPSVRFYGWRQCWRAIIRAKYSGCGNISPFQPFLSNHSKRAVLFRTAMSFRIGWAYFWKNRTRSHNSTGLRGGYLCSLGFTGQQ